MERLENAATPQAKNGLTDGIYITQIIFQILFVVISTKAIKINCTFSGEIKGRF
jgi:hypothetical protein